MLIKQIDHIRPKSLQRSFSNFLDVFRPAIQIAPSCFGCGSSLEAELGGDRNSITKRSQGFTYEFFIREWAVHFGGIEQGDASFNGRPNQSDHFLFVFGRAVTKAHSHTAQPDG